jgi:hypothetical protein
MSPAKYSYILYISTLSASKLVFRALFNQYSKSIGDTLITLEGLKNEYSIIKMTIVNKLQHKNGTAPMFELLARDLNVNIEEIPLLLKKLANKKKEEERLLNSERVGELDDSIKGPTERSAISDFPMSSPMPNEESKVLDKSFKVILDSKIKECQKLNKMNNDLKKKLAANIPTVGNDDSKNALRGILMNLAKSIPMNCDNEMQIKEYLKIIFKFLSFSPIEINEINNARAKFAKPKKQGLFGLF